MATIDLQTIQDGERNVIVHADIAGDADPDLANETVIDVSALVPVPDEVKIRRVWASLHGFTAVLLWNADTNKEFLAIPDGDDIEHNYQEIGGLINDAGTGKNGDVLVTTNGSAAGDHGTIIIWAQKKGIVS